MVNKKNPFLKYMTKEDNMQHAIMNYIKFNYPDVLAIHVPNEGKRSPFERYKFKFLGGVAGVPDILIFKSNDSYCGLAIELKVGYNKPTANQLNCLKQLKKGNWAALWSNNSNEVIRIIDRYFNNEF